MKSHIVKVEVDITIVKEAKHGEKFIETRGLNRSSVKARVVIE